ncbi:MAG: DUF4364 family protein [Oscillospiraceae bacterium]|nr:DUF4364 family protein [Oscillospiraceae bacterium]
MDSNFGFIHEKLDIKILILFILRRLPEAISLDVLTDLTMCDDGINYFDFANCVEELVRTEHLRLEDGRYSLTEKGRRNGKITEINLPYSVRMKAEKSATALRAVQSRNAMIKTTHKNNPGGSCTVTLALSDGVGEIISMDLFAANENQALDLEKGFRKNAEKIYNELIKLILEL